MTVELVKAIKDAENEAEKKIREAQQSARQVIREAENAAETELKQAVAAAGEEAKKLILKAEEEAAAETIPINQKQLKTIAALKAEAAGRMPKALALLKEKVVNTDADH